MGCFCSKYFDDQPGVAPHSSVKRLIRPVWKTPKPWTEEELQVMICPYNDALPEFVSALVTYSSMDPLSRTIFDADANQEQNCRVG